MPGLDELRDWQARDLTNIMSSLPRRRLTDEEMDELELKFVRAWRRCRTAAAAGKAVGRFAEALLRRYGQ
jgi:hypothetical protein